MMAKKALRLPRRIPFVGTLVVTLVLLVGLVFSLQAVQQKTSDQGQAAKKDEIILYGLINEVNPCVNQTLCFKITDAVGPGSKIKREYYLLGTNLNKFLNKKVYLWGTLVTGRPNYLKVGKILI